MAISYTFTIGMAYIPHFSITQFVNTLIHKVRLQTEHLEEAYRYVGRKPKRGLEQECVIEILGET